MEYVTLSRQQLFHLVWSEPFLTLSKKYNISDTGLRKICLRMDIPFPKTGHWQRVHAGSNVATPKFRSNLNIGDTITLELREPEVIDSNEPKLAQIQRIIENDPRVSLVVPENLSSRNPQIVLARKSLTDNTYYRHRPNDIRNTDMNHLNIRASKSSVNRALRLMDTLIKALRARGHDVAINSETYAVVFNQNIKIGLRETTKRILAQNSHNKYDYVPTGFLAFQMDGWHKDELKDGKEPLEQQLSKIIAWLEIEGKEMQNRAFERAIDDAETREVKEVKELFNMVQRKDLVAFRTLLDTAKQWQQANTLREFLNAVEGRAEQQSPDFQASLKWASHKIEWYDPIVNADDPYMVGVNKSTLEPPDLSSWEKDSWMYRF